MPFPVSAAFKKHVNYSHRIKVEIYVLDSDGVRTPVPLVISEGNITEDLTNDVQGQCSLTLVDPVGDLIPQYVTDLLAPGVQEIQIMKGIYLPNESEPEMVPMGVYNYTDVDIDYTGESLTIKLQGFDRSKQITEARFLDIWVTTGGTTVIKAIKDIILSRNASAKFKFPEFLEDTVSQANFERGSDPWKACQTLAEVAGMRLFLDREGYFTLAPVPTLSATPDWTFNETEVSTLLTISKKLAISEYNHVIEIAEGNEVPVPFRAEAKDQESIDTTGDRPVFHVSPLYTDVSQCQRAADAKLERIRGNTENLGLQVIPNPAITPGDIIKVTNTKTKVDSVYIVDRVATPLGTGQGQYLTTRKRVTNA